MSSIAIGSGKADEEKITVNTINTKRERGKKERKKERKKDRKKERKKERKKVSKKN